MEKKQTAVEWFIEQLKDYDFADIKDNEYYIIKIPTWILKEKEIQAKEIEQHQLEFSYNEGVKDCEKVFKEIIENVTKNQEL